MKHNLLVLTLLFSTCIAEAADSNRCITIDYENGGYENICSRTVALSLCVNNPSSMFSCTGSTDKYLIDVLPKGVGHGILYYQRDGRGDIAVVTCNYPLRVTGWKGPNSSYSCADPDSKNLHKNR